MTDLVVVGGGPAGLACALAAARLGLRIVLVEAAGFGGQLLNAGEIEAGGAILGAAAAVEIAAMLVEQASDSGAELRLGAVDTVRRSDDGWRITGRALDVTAPAVVLATGTREAPFAVPGADRLEGMGVSRCAACDGPLFAAGDVAVVGGGRLAMWEALHLAGLVRSVTVLVRAGDALDPVAERRLGAAARPIAVVTGCSELEVVGEERVAGVAYRAGGERTRREVAGVFAAEERRPASDLVAGVAARDARGAVVTTDRVISSAPGLLVAGDVSRARQGLLLEALGDGQAAAYAAAEHVAGTGTRARAGGMISGVGRDGDSGAARRRG